MICYYSPFQEKKKDTGHSTYTYGNIKRLMKEITVEIKEEKKKDRMNMNPA